MSEVKILQFGAGAFLRCFVDWMVQRMNERAGFDGQVRVVQGTGAELRPLNRILNEHGGRYHTCLRGIAGGRPVEILEENTCIESVVCAATDWARVEEAARMPSLRFVVSNTTEAGIEYRAGADTFPRKLARVLRVRHAAGLPGLVMLPCELIEHNGAVLRECVLKHLDDEVPGDDSLRKWIDEECVFCSTLVDRIVSGRPEPESAARYAEQLGEDDPALVCGEPFHFLAVELPVGFDLERELPLRRAGLEVAYTQDLAPYRTRKVRFLNGAHTATIPEGLLAGFSEVAQLVDDPHFREHFDRILFEEIAPTVDLPDAERRAYASSVLERFANPHAHHRLASIALNSVSKWRVRVLPTILDSVARFQVLPRNLVRSFGWLYRFCLTDQINDGAEVVAFFQSRPSLQAFMAREDWWGMDLNSIDGFHALAASVCN